MRLRAFSARAMGREYQGGWTAPKRYRSVCVWRPHAALTRAQLRSTFLDRGRLVSLIVWVMRGEGMSIPTELVGSLPRPMKLQEAYASYDDGAITWEQLQAEQDAAAEDSIRRLEDVGEPIVTDGEQRESSFATYPLTDTLAGTGLAENLGPEGQFFAIFDDGHHRQLPRLTGGPFRYKTYASEFV